MLLRLGATPIRNSDDILDALGLAKSESKKPSQESLFAECSAEEKEILAHLGEPINRDELDPRFHELDQLIAKGLGDRRPRGAKR